MPDRVISRLPVLGQNRVRFALHFLEQEIHPFPKFGSPGHPIGKLREMAFHSGDFFANVAPFRK